MAKHRSFRLTKLPGPYKFSLGSLFRLQTAVAGVLGTVILSRGSLGGHEETVWAFAFLGTSLSYGISPRSLRVIPYALITVTLAGIFGALAGGSSNVNVLASGLVGSLIGAFAFLGFGGTKEN